MFQRQKVISWCFRIAAAAILIYVLGMSCLYVFLQRDPDELLASYLSEISTRTGLKFEIGSIDVTLLPLPAFAVSDVKIIGNGLVFTASWVQARPTLSGIFHGEIFPGRISVLRPKIQYRAHCPLTDPKLIAQELSRSFPASANSAGTLPASLQLEINQGEAEIAGSDGATAQLANLDTGLTLSNAAISGFARISACRLINSGETVWSLENFACSGRSSLSDFLTDTHDLKVSGAIKWPGYVRSVRIVLDFGSSRGGWQGQGSLSGDLDIGNEPIPFGLSARAASLTGSHETVFRGVQWHLGADSGSSDLSLRISDNNDGFLLKGMFFANRVSLTQWLGFARNLCPGLQLALDNITDARLEFSLDNKSLSVPRIAASCCGAFFTGSGGVASWQKPVVALDLHTREANLGLGLPESVAATPDAPYYGHPTLTPLPGTPLKPGEQGIAYDIRLAAALLHYGPLKINNAGVRIYPGKMDKSGLEDVLLDGKGNLYGGTVTGSCILGADKKLPMHIAAKAEKVNGSAISKDMPLLPFRKGIWRGNATVTSSGKQLALFLANLRGNVSATGNNATLAATGDKMPFEQVAAAARLRSASWNGKHLTMDAQWSGSVKAAKMAGASELNGKLLFGRDGMTFCQLPGTVTASIAELPDGGNVKLGGKFSGSSSKNSYEVANASLEFLGIIIHGSGKLNGAKENISGKMQVEIAKPQQLLQKAGFRDATLPKAMTPIKLSADFTADEKEAKFTKLDATLGKLRTSGALACDYAGKTPEFTLDLTLQSLHLADFISKQPAQTAWNFHFLTSFDASGDIRIKELTGWNASFQNFHAPFALKNGQLLANGINARFYGAPITGSFEGDFRNGLTFDSITRVNGFDLGAAAAEQKMESRLTGKASAEMRLGAKLTGKAKLAAALNGKWSFSVKNGSWQDVKKGKPGKITQFNVAEAFGTVRAGVVRSNNFHLGGPGLSVTGKGSLNLSAQTLDCDFYVSMKGLPDFPLRLYGSLKDMKTSIGAGRMILNAVGDVTGGFVNSVGDLLKGAWGIFAKD